MNTRIKIATLLIILPLALGACNNQSGQGASTEDQAINHKVDSLLAKMTLTEKIGQMTLYTSDFAVTGPTMRPGYMKDIRAGKMGALFNAFGADYVRKLQHIAVDSTRLGIPLIFGFDVIHGFRTTFPVPLGEAASWDMDQIRKSERVAATEATAEGLNWVYAPMVDIARDPRWGRIVEGAGEDPYLGSQIAKARVMGFQGTDLSAPNTVVACVKHFAAYGAATAGRDYNTVDMSRLTLFNDYLPPYKAAVDAGVGTVMTAFDDLNGIPATANHYILTDILKKRWGFKGFVVTDYTSINELINHGIAADSAQAGELAANAGVDMDMQGAIFENKLPGLVKSGKVSMDRVNDAVRRILRIKYKLGLFADPYRYVSNERQKNDILTPENLKVARQMARESIVLLKNQNNLLPLSKHIHTLAVIGPLANDQEDLIGPWAGAGNYHDAITLLDGIKKAVSPGTRILYAKGSDNAIGDTDESGFAKAVNVARRADVVILAVGEKSSMSGEASSRAHIDLPGVQPELVKRIVATGKPVVVVLMNGRPLTIPWTSDHASAIVETWFLGTEAGPAIADVLFGDYNPSGKLPVTFPRDVGQIPIYYNHMNTGRPFDAHNKYTSKYLDEPNTPQYPFGFGLSYTTFSYSAPKLSESEMGWNDTLSVSTKVTNTGKRAGTEVVQLYIRDMVGSVTRPVEELKGFRRITLDPGASKEVTFKLTRKDLSFYNKQLVFGAEPGAFKVFVGGNSQDVQQADFTLKSAR